jgi:signal transduction histidine kinase
LPAPALWWTNSNQHPDPERSHVALFRFHNLGIAKKITLGFYSLLFFMLGTAVLTYTIVMQIEAKVIIFESLEEIFYATLEARRFEKNYFLYQQEKDFEENQQYCRQLQKMLAEKKEQLNRIISTPDLEHLAATIASYSDYLTRLHDFNTRGSGEDPKRVGSFLEEKVRGAGKILTDFAEHNQLAAKNAIKTKLRTTRSILLLSFLLLFFLGGALATLLGRQVVNALKRLEGHTRRISQGDFTEIAVKDSEMEIQSLLLAFNRMTQELRIKQQQLVQSEKLAALGTLLSGVAHELNNPLSNISTSAQILAEELDNPDHDFKRNLLQQIESQSDKARDIVRTLLEFSRIKEFNKERLRLAGLVRESILLIRGQVPSGVEIAVEVPDDLEIIADKQRLQQVLLNLIKNGIDATGGQGHIWVTARRTSADEQEGEVEIMVEDDGPGIDRELLNRIFDPFFTTKDVGKGSGLGLFVVHDIVEWHGGAINVDSRLGVGTTFTIWLPGEKQPT